MLQNHYGLMWSKMSSAVVSTCGKEENMMTTLGSDAGTETKQVGAERICIVKTGIRFLLLSLAVIN